MTLPRSIYADKFRHVADFTFSDQSLSQHRGQWRDWFQKRIGPTFNGRIVLEIGCFDATYLHRIAHKFPDTAFIGLDWKCKPLYEGAQTIADLNLRNIALLRGRAQDLSRLFGPLELDEIWIFHPDPCDRPVELKNRLIAESFLLEAHIVLRNPTATLTLKTDHLGYYQWTLALLGLPLPSAAGTLTGKLVGVTSASEDTGGTQSTHATIPTPLPNPSQAVQAHFDVTMNSPHFWHDPAAQAHAANRCFSGEITLFESRFVKKRLPIYYLDLRKK